VKISVSGTILATSLNLGAMVNDGFQQQAVSAVLPGEAQQTGDVSHTPNVASVIHTSDEFYTTVQPVPVGIEWDNRAEKRFQALAVKEATEALSGSEFVELEQLTKVRRKHTAPPVSANELLEELRQWQSISRVFEALARYVEEIGVKRDAVTNRP
jgi:hypothetical protein